jgi:solute carrier family 12 (potassium/chloride transporters), member 9
VNDPRRQFKLIQFCNSLKKGGLFVLGHVIVTDDFATSLPEAKRQQTTWMKYIDFSKIKAFINIAISPAYEWGARNIVLNAGLGGMRPNLTVLGFFNMGDLRRSQALIDIPSPQPSRPMSRTERHKDVEETGTRRSRRERDAGKWHGNLPTDINRPEGAIDARSYVTVLEDLLIRLQTNVAIGKGFQDLELPAPKPTRAERLLTWLHLRDPDEEENEKKFIDLWPIQMSAEIATEGIDKKNILTTNFDTYTLILQLGAILNTVQSWKRSFKLRVSVFVEYESDVEEERGRVIDLLTNLRIKACVRVFYLASSELKTYEVIVNGQKGDGFNAARHTVDSTLEDEDWWQEIRGLRAKQGNISALEELAEAESILDSTCKWPNRAFFHSRAESTATNATGATRFEGLRKMIRKAKRRGSISGLSTEMKLQSSALDPKLVEHFRAYDSPSESSSSGDDDGTDGSVTDEVALSDDEGSRRSSIDSRPKFLRRSRSFGSTIRERFFGSPRRTPPRSKVASPAARERRKVLSTHPEGISSDTAALVESRSPAGPSSPRALTAQPSPRLRPQAMRHQSAPKFTSRPVPEARVSSEEGPGPSIMFAEPSTPPTLRPPDRQYQSIYARDHSAAPSAPPGPSTASGFPSLQSIPLTFNDLPCRAQHLILNELIVSQSDETAVLFTTLPSPVEGTGDSEDDSVRYLADLDVLCQGLPPVLLVHSNSMTVTMNL